MLGYYRSWTLVFAVLGYYFGLSAGFDAVGAVWIIPSGGAIGLFLAWFSEARTFRVGLQGWMVFCGISGIAIANLAFGLPDWAIVLVMLSMVIVGSIVLFALDIGPAAKWVDHQKELGRPGTSSYVPL